MPMPKVIFLATECPLQSVGLSKKLFDQRNKLMSHLSKVHKVVGREITKKVNKTQRANSGESDA